MTTETGDKQLTLDVVDQCQIEIRGMLETLSELSQTTGMESWSFQIKHHYRVALNDLAALEAYLEIFKLSSMDKAQTNGGNPDGTSLAS